MKALLVIDVQNGIVENGNFEEELLVIESLIKDFQESGNPIIFMKHIEDVEDSPLARGSVGSDLHPAIKDYAERIIEKQTPSSFYQTTLAETLGTLGVDHLVLTGFEAEFCCMFTAIAAYDRGYKVTFIKNGIGAVNTADTYNMPGLDINSFVSKVLGWSGTIEVIEYDK
jgi:nicotinamidase-related amidase